MYPACAILATHFNFLVWFTKQSDHCPKLALQKSLMRLSYPFRDRSWLSSREAQVSTLLILGPPQPHEPFCVIPNWVINSQSNVQYVKESRASVSRRGSCFFLRIQLACSPVMQGRGHWKMGELEPRLISLRCWSWASHWSSLGLSFLTPGELNSMDPNTSPSLVIYGFTNKKWPQSF